MSEETLENAIWIGASVLYTDMTVDFHEAKKLVPPGLELDHSSKATIFIADYPTTTFGSSYKEAAVILHCRDKKGEARFCPWMVVDDDTALILGRELLGFPKKMAEIDLQESSNYIRGTVARKGTELIRIEGDFGDEIESPEPLFARRMVNLFGSIVGGMKLLDMAPASEAFHRSRQVSAKVFLGTSDRDHLGLLSATVECEAVLSAMDFGGSSGELPVLSENIDEAWAAATFFNRAF